MDIDLISMKEACRILDRDKATLGRWVKDGRIAPAYKGEGKNGIMLFNRADIEALT
jgi:hypothetical protein